MSHRIATFFRAHSSPFELPTDLKRTSRRLSSSHPTISELSPSSSGSSLLASEDTSVKMAASALKRLSLSGGKPKKDAITLDVLIESPPLVLYGSTSASTGALLSGLLKVNTPEDVAITSFKMKLTCNVTMKKPFHNHCPECQNQTTDLMVWDFFKKPILEKGLYNIPFSFLLKGHLPATMKGSLSVIDYALQASIVPNTGEPIKLTQKLNVMRAITPSDQPRHSIRIFPPTNLTANCVLPPVIHPIGEAKVSLRMDGVIKRNPDMKTQTHWKLKRLTWHLDETQRVISPACAKHSAKLGPDAEENKKGIQHQDVRTIGSDEIKSGWKTDYSTPDGSIELEFPFHVRADSKPICDMKAEDGTEVMHILIVEMIVAEEFASIKKPAQATPTGAARVLRMHFNVTLTERSGLGISWDEEQPPLYENVPASPPAYAQGTIHAYEDLPIPDYEDLSPLDDPTPTTDITGSNAEESSEGNGEGSSRRLGSLG